MLYRIRYHGLAVTGEGEMTVEANSPNEAVVKFRHIRAVPSRCAPADERVTSVFADDEFSDDLS